MTLFNFLSQVSPMSEAVLSVLLFLSALSWGIVFYKLYIVSRSVKENRQFVMAFKRTDRFSRLYQEAVAYRKSTLAFIFRAGYEKVQALKDKWMVAGGKSSEMDLDVIHRTLLQASQEEQARLEAYLPVLATTANIAPFVGLLGTVWGIIHAFRDISHQASASIASVAPGIADALVTTAAGLFTAIPAVIFYNYFLQKIRQIQGVADTFTLEILNVVSEERWKD